MPSIAHDQYGHLAQPDRVGLHQSRGEDRRIPARLHVVAPDATNRFDPLDFQFLSRGRAETRGREPANLCLHQPALSPRLLPLCSSPSPTSGRSPSPAAVCNWNARLHADGGDAAGEHQSSISRSVAATWCRCGWTTTFNVDKRIPAHMYNLTNTFSDRQYLTVQDHQRRQRALCRSASAPRTTARSISSFAINATAGSAAAADERRSDAGLPGRNPCRRPGQHHADRCHHHLRSELARSGHQRVLHAG